MCRAQQFDLLMQLCLFMREFTSIQELHALTTGRDTGNMIVNAYTRSICLLVGHLAMA